MTLKQKIEIGTIVTITLAVIGFAFWLGGLQSTVNDLKSGEEIDRLKIAAMAAIAEIEDKAKNIFWSIPTGSIIAYSGEYDPNNRDLDDWIECDGDLIVRNEDPEKWARLRKLREVIGTTYGGTTNVSFALPDLRGRVAIGVNLIQSETGLSEVKLGQKDGKEFGNYEHFHQWMQYQAGPGQGGNYFTVSSGHPTQMMPRFLNNGASADVASYRVGEQNQMFGGNRLAAYITWPDQTKTMNDSNYHNDKKQFSIMQPYQTVTYLIKYK